MHEHLSFKFCWFGGLAALIGGALLGFGARAADLGDTHTLNLEEAIRMALGQSSPALEAAGARIEAAAGRAYQAKQWTNPQLQLNAEEWPVSRGRGFSDAIQTIGIVQTLPYPGKKSLDKRIGGIGVRVSEAEWASRCTEVVRDVKAGFSRVLLALARLVEASTQLVAVAQSSATAARKRVEAGAAPDQEQLRAEVQLVQVQSGLMDFERDLDIARQAL